MSKSEHSDSSFYYPGKLSDAEMLQLPSHSEATERKSLLSNQEIKKFRTSQQQAITVKKTTYYDMNVFQKWPKNERSWKSPQKSCAGCYAIFI